MKKPIILVGAALAVGLVFASSTFIFFLNMSSQQDTDSEYSSAEALFTASEILPNNVKPGDKVQMEYLQDNVILEWTLQSAGSVCTAEGCVWDGLPPLQGLPTSQPGTVKKSPAQGGTFKVSVNPTQINQQGETLYTYWIVPNTDTGYWTSEWVIDSFTVTFSQDINNPYPLNYAPM